MDENSGKSEIKRINTYACGCVIVASVISIIFGHNTGVISGALIFFQEDLKITDVQVEILAGTLNLCALLSSTVAGRTAENICSRYTSVLASIIFFLGAIVMVLGPLYPVVMTGRCVAGIAVGFAFMIGPVYSAEISSLSSRGFLTSYPEVCINLGLLLRYLSNYFFSKLALRLGWRMMFGATAISSLSLALGVLEIPESPRWLVLQGRLGEARKILFRVCDSREEADIRLRDIKAAAGIDEACNNDVLAKVQTNSRGQGVWKELLVRPTRSVRWLLIASVGLHFFHHTTGIEAVVLYSHRVLRKAGVVDKLSIKIQLFESCPHVRHLKARRAIPLSLSLITLMRKLCPNIEREDGLETVLEVPIPEEMFKSMGDSTNVRFQNMLTWMKAQNSDKWSSPIIAARLNELRFLLYLVGSPLIPLQVQLSHSIHRPVKDSSIQASTAKYIVQQYVAATGGQPALNMVQSMCVTGAVKIRASEFHQSDDDGNVDVKKSSEELGGFVIWQKNPDMWCIELVVSGCKVISGSNGKLSWRHSSSQQTPIPKGPPRPLRRFLQGLDPRATANLFLDATCVGEKIIDEEDCFILKLETSPEIREAQSGPNYEIIHHTLWGYFSQRLGLLVQFEDSKLLRMNNATTGSDDEGGVFWETSTESVMGDYRYIDGVNIAHSGKTTVTVFRYGEQSANHKREMEETWKIEEVNFNVCGLNNDCFLPPSDRRHQPKQKQNQHHPQPR